MVLFSLFLVKICLQLGGHLEYMRISYLVEVMASSFWTKSTARVQSQICLAAEPQKGVTMTADQMRMLVFCVHVRARLIVLYLLIT